MRKDVKMQAIGIVLLLISIGTIVGPVGAVVVMYHNDLTQLVIPPQIRDLMNGNSSLIPQGSSDGGGDGGIGGLMSPTLVSVQSDPAAHTFSAVFNVTNPTDYDLTLNSLSANALMTQQQIPAGSISLANPVTAPAGQTTQLTITGQWTQQIQDYMTTNFPGMTSVEIYVKDVVININGIIVESSGIIDVGNVPFDILG